MSRTDTDSRSADNGKRLTANGIVSCIHRRKPGHIRRGNAKRSSVRAWAEHVFGYRKGPMDLTIRCIGPVLAAGRITMANLICFLRRAAGMRSMRPVSALDGTFCLAFGTGPRIAAGCPHPGRSDRKESPRGHAEGRVDRGVHVTTMRSTSIVLSKPHDRARSNAICIPTRVSALKPNAFDSR